MAEKTNLCHMVKTFHCSAHKHGKYNNCQYGKQRFADESRQDCRFHTLNGECTSEDAKKEAKDLGPILS